MDALGLSFSMRGLLIVPWLEIKPGPPALWACLSHRITCEAPNSQQFLRREQLCFLFSHSVVSDSVTPWNAAHQASLSFTRSQSLLKPMSIESVMPSSHLILSSPSLPAFNLFFFFKHISFNCQDYSRARVHFQSLLSGLRSSVAQPRPSFQFILEFALPPSPRGQWERRGPAESE